MSDLALNPAEFRRLLHNGLGRALLYLRDHDATPHRETILHACLHNTVFDRQVNGSNARYIFEAIELTRDAASYRDALLTALRHPDEAYHLGQICDLLGCFAHRGDHQARQALYDAFNRGDDGGYAAMFELVELDGFSGFFHVADSLGQEVAADDDFWEGAHFLRQLDEHFGEQVVRDRMAEACVNNTRIAAYIAAIELTTEQSERTSPQRIRFDAKTMGYDELKAVVSGKGRWSLVSLRTWGEKASDNDILKLADDVLAESDPARLHTYLRAFASRPFPHGHQPLFQFADHPNHRVMHAAIEALGNFRHPEVRALALRLLPTHRAWAALDLLIGNYQDGDYLLIEIALAQPADQSEEEQHWFEMGVRQLFKQYPSAAATPALLLVYEYGRCLLCRYSTVKLLHQLGALPEAIRFECEYDADFDTREAAKQHFRDVSAPDAL